MFIALTKVNKMNHINILGISISIYATNLASKHLIFKVKGF